MPSFNIGIMKSQLMNGNGHWHFNDNSGLCNLQFRPLRAGICIPDKLHTLYMYIHRDKVLHNIKAAELIYIDSAVHYTYPRS